MRPVLLLLAAAACGTPDSRPEEPVGVQVTGCSDPTLWTAPTPETSELRWYVGGHSGCAPPQYPLHTAGLQVAEYDVLENEDTTCWRVTAAAPGSGWTAGQEFSTTGPIGPRMRIAGFERPVTVEGRGVRADGELVLAIEPATVQLDEPVVVATDAGAAIGIATTELWSEADAVHAFGKRIPTDPVLATTARERTGWSPTTIHRTAAGIVRRLWRREGTEVTFTDFVIAPAGTRVQMGSYPFAFVVDQQLIILGSQGTTTVVKFRIPLAAVPTEVVAAWDTIFLHIGNEIVQYNYTTGAMKSLTVGEGRLLPVATEGVLFFDGTTFTPVGLSTPPMLVHDQAFTPMPEELAALGTPAGLYVGYLFGENGILAGDNSSSSPPGPRFLSFADLFGAGSSLGGVAVDGRGYLIKHADGSGEVYETNYSLDCE